MIWTLPLKIIYSITISCLFVVPAIVGYALHIHIARKSFWALGVYGTVVFCFIILQLLFATLNRIMLARYREKTPLPVSAYKSESTEQQQQQSPTTTPRKASKIGLAVVGYREEPTLFLQCLESIQRLRYPDPFKIVVVVDGKDQEDHEMASIFEKAFPGHSTVVLPYLMSERALAQKNPKATSSTEQDPEKMEYKKYDMDPVKRQGSSSSSSSSQDEERVTMWEGEEPVLLPTDTRAVCYLQPHCGKRHAMYTAFRVLMEAGCDAIMSTDSDTKFDPNAMVEMERALYWHPNIGAAAGDVRIWNAGDSLLSFMSSLRYWMAFNIERAAQSFNRCVTCVSGPMGLYRSSVLAEILDDWIAQRFLGMECTYGDDR